MLWFIYWPKASNVHEALTQDWNQRLGNDEVVDSNIIIPKCPLVICGQSKRFYKSLLTPDLIKKEYNKARKIYL